MIFLKKSNSFNSVTLYLSLLLILVLPKCTTQNKSDYLAHPISKAEPIQNDSELPTEAELIREILDSVGFVSLPVMMHFDSSIQKTYRIMFDRYAPLIKQFNVRGDMYVIGFLPDTTHYYGALINFVGAVGDPGLLTFDKKGKLIDEQILTEQNCLQYAGEIFLCQEYTSIESDLSLNYHYKSIIGHDTGVDDELNTVCENRIREGQVTSSGQIKWGEAVNLDCSPATPSTP